MVDFAFYYTIVLQCYFAILSIAEVKILANDQDFALVNLILCPVPTCSLHNYWYY